MADFSIRPARPDDAAAVVTLGATVHPYLVRGVARTRLMIAEPPPGEDWAAFVAERDGEPVGWVSAYRKVRTTEPDFGQISLLQVHPTARGRGIGGALFAAAAGHLRAAGVRRAAVTATPQALPFARRRGFEPVRELRYSALELAALDGVPADRVPDGVRLIALRETTAEELYAADVVAAADEPGDVAPQPPSFESWRYDIWQNPGLDHDCSTAALVAGEIVSFSLLVRDGDRVWSDMTATAPGHRGRGLARLVKSVALRRAAATGVTRAFTSNDEANLPMLAVNTRLGYRPVASQFSCVGSLEQSSGGR
ncbi:GNAT superfamily N-acetyltransferase [Actinoplanes octamycinicus]|uniref:GNAT superfamily N-acetyltransferase n=1 Tax=Actinoplanes octamycinicus TaxID=135948 RepID=A0A7W7GSY5_9ACTN|nr:GNAT family N-acetyltransferase [Actinoplanes octamycinicus]MBB4737725.1 GNAT superfamily N-acetyltransferase [Actinoplanes octamycinicus]GIE58026.1 N-acetyltransferase [Actinoplanes octamycinicus]